MALVKGVELTILVLLTGYSVVLGFVAPGLDGEEVASNLDEIVEIVNNAGSTWTAGKNFQSDLSRADFERFVSNIDPTSDLDQKPRSCDCGLTAKDLGVDEFDARIKWPNCPTISQIQNQGACKSSWAVAAAAVISDRQCVASNGAIKDPMSAQHLLSCCGECGGCNGGWSRKAFNYYKKHGVVTGGAYNSQEGCQPFALEPTSNFNSPSDENTATPQCAKECTNKQYSKSMKKDLHFGKEVTTPCCCTIKTVLPKDGPIITSMVVFEDFFAYKSGVYRHIWGKKVGYQTVRILGWGTENGVDYWLAANSWGTSWGDGGLFKIQRGEPNCMFEFGYSAPIPKIKQHE